MTVLVVREVEVPPGTWPWNEQDSDPPAGMAAPDPAQVLSVITSLIGASKSPNRSLLRPTSVAASSPPFTTSTAKGIRFPPVGTTPASGRTVSHTAGSTAPWPTPAESLRSTASSAEALVTVAVTVFHSISPSGGT